MHEHYASCPLKRRLYLAPLENAQFCQRECKTYCDVWSHYWLTYTHMLMSLNSEQVALWKMSVNKKCIHTICINRICVGLCVCVCVCVHKATLLEQSQWSYISLSVNNSCRVLETNRPCISGCVIWIYAGVRFQMCARSSVIITAAWRQGSNFIMHILRVQKRLGVCLFLHPNTIFVIDLIIILPEMVEWGVKIEEYVTFAAKTQTFDGIMFRLLLKFLHNFLYCGCFWILSNMLSRADVTTRADVRNTP